MNPRALSECRLYTFVDTAYLAGRDPIDVGQALCDGGADLLQVRAKGSSPDEVQRLTERLLPICQSAGVWLVVNDHPQVAKVVGAPLCHLGQEDFFGAGHHHVHELLSMPSHMGIGLSSHAPSQAERAVQAGAAYVAVGPVFATATKPDRSPVTLNYVRWAADHLRLPWFAIGGITLDNLEEVLAAGASRICAVSAILNAKDIRAACRGFRRRIERRVPSRPGTA